MGKLCFMLLSLLFCKFNFCYKNQENTTPFFPTITITILSTLGLFLELIIVQTLEDHLYELTWLTCLWRQNHVIWLRT